MGILNSYGVFPSSVRLFLYKVNFLFLHFAFQKILKFNKNKASSLYTTPWENTKITTVCVWRICSQRTHNPFARAHWINSQMLVGKAIFLHFLCENRNIFGAQRNAKEKRSNSWRAHDWLVVQQLNFVIITGGMNTRVKCHTPGNGRGKTLESFMTQFTFAAATVKVNRFSSVSFLFFLLFQTNWSASSSERDILRGVVRVCVCLCCCMFKICLISSGNSFYDLNRFIYRILFYFVSLIVSGILMRCEQQRGFLCVC